MTFVDNINHKQVKSLSALADIFAIGTCYNVKVGNHRKFHNRKYFRNCESNIVNIFPNVFL